MSGLDFQPVHIPFISGPDTKHDPRSLPNLQMAVVENAVFDKLGGIQKCPGRSAINLVAGVSMGEGNPPADANDFKALMSYRDELLLVGDNTLYSRAPNAGRTGGTPNSALGVVNRGRFESVRTEHRTVVPTVQGGVIVDRAETDDIEVHAWGFGIVYYRCTDQITGAILNDRSQTEVWTDNSIATAVAAKCRAVGGKLHIYYVDSSSSPRNLKVLVIDPADVDGTITSTPKTLRTDVHAASQYDVVVDVANGQSLIAYRNDTGTGEYTMIRVTPDGALSGSAVPKGRAVFGALSIDYNVAADQILVARISGAGSIHFDWLVASTFVDGTFNVSVTADTPAGRVACTARGVNTGYVFWDTLAGTVFYRVKRAAVTTSLGTTKVLCRHSKIGSRAIISNDGRTLMHVVYSTRVQQNQYILWDCEQTIGDENGGQSAGDEAGMLARVFVGEALIPTTTVAHLPNIENTAPDEYKCGLTTVRQLSASQRRPLMGAMTTERGLREVHYTFGDARSYDAVEMGKTLYIPGGFVGAYDGKRAYENGFFVYPEVDEDDFTEVTDTLGFHVPGVFYSYRFYWEWYNDKGERQMSTFAGEVTRQLVGGAMNSYDVAVPTLPYTYKEKVVLAVYRKMGDGVTGDPYYRVSTPRDIGTDPSYVVNDPNADTVTFHDITYDETDMLSNELDYQNTGELDNVAAPVPPLVLAGGQGRLFSVHPEDESTIFYSKIREDGKMVAFNENLYLNVPHVGGKVTAISPGEDAILVFKENAIYVAAGQGPNNLAQGDYGPPRLVTADQGCTEPRSVVRVPHGVVFKGDKGWHLIDRAYKVHFIGGPVEDWNDRVVTGVLAYPSEHRIVVLSSDAAGSYMFDYLAGERGQWSDWPVLHGITDGVLSQGLAYHLEGSDIVTYETPETFGDVAAYGEGLQTRIGYSRVIDTGWIKVADLQGFAKVRWWELLGEWQGTWPFDIRVRVAYNYDDAWIDDKTFTPPAAMAIDGQPIRVRRRFSKMKASAVRVRIEDVQQGAETSWGEGARLTGLALSVGLKPGLFRLPAAQTM